MESKTARVNSPHGLHLRTAAEVVNLAKQFESRISLEAGGYPTADGRSVLQLLLLEAGQGSSLKISAEGPDAQEAVLALSEYFEHGGGI
jgi:phosphotransferase system HPr (HPr) family protein